MTPSVASKVTRKEESKQTLINMELKLKIAKKLERTQNRIKIYLNLNEKITGGSKGIYDLGDTK